MWLVNTASNYTETDDIIIRNIKNWLLACTKINFTDKGILQKKEFSSFKEVVNDHILDRWSLHL